jgi:hypothetical protein
MGKGWERPYAILLGGQSQNGKEESVVLVKHDLDGAIVNAQVALDALKSFRDSLDK